MITDLTYDGIDISQGLIVSGIAMVFLAIYYLYQKENRVIMAVIGYLTRYHYSPPEKDTRQQEWLLFLVMLALIVILGIKAITLMVVVSDSMRPEFQRGDMIVTQSIFMNLEKGDIITFHVQDQKMAESHRIIAIDGDHIKTQGDNVPLPDSFRITKKDVIAKAITFNGHPLVIKNLGALFITDYSQSGVISRFGDKFTFMQQLSATLKTWGFIVCILAVLTYLVLMKRGCDRI